MYAYRCPAANLRVCHFVYHCVWEVNISIRSLLFGISEFVQDTSRHVRKVLTGFWFVTVHGLFKEPGFELILTITR